MATPGARALASASVAFVIVATGARARTEPRADSTDAVVVGARQWRTIPSESGPVNYYTVVTDPVAPYIRARYRPPWKTSVLGIKVAESDARRVRKLRWRWRAITLPIGGDECVSARADSAAVVYVTWKRGLRHYSLKYVWSSVGRKGSTCDRRRSPFVAQDTIALESGGPVGIWRDVEIDLASEFRRHFEGGDPKAAIPDLIGFGLMTDGDQTRSESAADYGTFVLVR